MFHFLASRENELVTGWDVVCIINGWHICAWTWLKILCRSAYFVYVRTKFMRENMGHLYFWIRIMSRKLSERLYRTFQNISENKIISYKHINNSLKRRHSSKLTTGVCFQEIHFIIMNSCSQKENPVSISYASGTCPKLNVYALKVPA